MADKIWDIVLLTDNRYIHPKPESEYVSNVFLEDFLVANALTDKGLTVTRLSWDDPFMDWSTTKYALFRSTWDYFDRFEEFQTWFEKANLQTIFINSYPLVQWNLNKNYLAELEEKGIRIPPTVFLKKGDKRTLNEIISDSVWKKIILKPAVSGAARHTYAFENDEISAFEAIFQSLILNEDMLLQEFQTEIETRGEVSLMVIGGKFSHAVLKKAKAGDFRVQDDFGGSVHAYDPSETEIRFAEKAVSLCFEFPIYARVDVMWNNEGELCLSELEMIEPEMWFRRKPEAAILLAEAIVENFGL